MIFRTGWDVDGVGHTFGDGVHRFLIHKGLGHLWKSGPTPKPFWDWYKDWNWTSQQFVDFCNEAADAGFLFTGSLRPGYAEAIERVARMGHEIIIVTDRSFGRHPGVSQKLTVEWFRHYEIDYDELWFSADKTVGRCQYFIDDKLENYDALDAVGTQVYLLNRPWNEQEGDNRRRIDHISEYADIIEHATQLSMV